MIKIDKKTYWIKDECHHKTQIAKTQLILGTTMRKDSNHILRLLHKDYGRTMCWNTYTVTRDGKIYQHYDPKYHTEFIGDKEIDKKSISVLIESMGKLAYNTEGNFVNVLNEKCLEENVYIESWLGCNYWEIIPEIQLNAAIELCKKIMDEHGIPKNIIEFHHYNREAHKFKGLVFRSNHLSDTNDFNPQLKVGMITNLFENDNSY